MTHAGKVSTDVQRRNRQAPINHGTESGWKAHRRRLQEPCEECKTAARIAGQDRREGRSSAGKSDPLQARREQAEAEIRALNRRDAETQRGAA